MPFTKAIPKPRVTCILASAPKKKKKKPRTFFRTLDKALRKFLTSKGSESLARTSSEVPKMQRLGT